MHRIGELRGYYTDHWEKDRPEMYRGQEGSEGVKKKYPTIKPPPIQNLLLLVPWN